MNTDYIKELKEGYFDETGTIRLCFIDGLPKKNADDFNKLSPALSTKQARSIFDKINTVHGQYLRKNISFNEAKAELVMMKSRINDKVNKGSIPKEFYEFFCNNVDNIDNANDIKAFKLYFEAICNYLKDKKEETQNNGNYNRNNSYNRNSGYSSHFGNINNRR